MGCCELANQTRGTDRTMTNTDLFHAFEVLAVLALVILFFAYPWQAFCTDIVRQRLFELRDRLFMLAVEGKMGFDDPVYVSFRNSLNNRIRYAERIVFGDLVAFLIAFRGEVPEIRTLDDEIVALEDQELRSKLLAMQLESLQLQLVHVVIRSPVILVFSILAPVIIMIALIHGGVRVCLRWLTEFAKVVDHSDFREHALD